MGDIKDVSRLVALLRQTADTLEEEGHGGLTGVVLVADAIPGVFAQDDVLAGTWVSMQGGRRLYRGLMLAAADVVALRDAKKKLIQ